MPEIDDNEDKEEHLSSKDDEKESEAASPTKKQDKKDDPQKSSHVVIQEDSSDSPSTIKLYKSSRLKGYLILMLASSINFNSALKSQDATLPTAVPATTAQKRYAMTASMTTVVLSVLIILCHFDLYSPLKATWNKWFSPHESRVELYLILFLVLWWVVATWIQTSVRGICGDGKGQYNLYFSTWVCLWTSIWTMERWMVACGHSSFNEFMASWPHRSPGFLSILVLSVSDLLIVIDLYTNWEQAAEESPGLKEQFETIAEGQWQWLFVVISLTIPSSAVFVFAELCRETSSGKTVLDKSEWEIILEGCVLLILVLCWIPTVILATTPGGVASLVGNGYFFIWGTTVFVMETSVWWIHDWRKRIHALLLEQEEDYRAVQRQVLQQTRNNVMEGSSEHVDRDVRTSNQGSNEENEIVLNEDVDDDSFDSDYDEAGIPDVVGM